MDRINTIDLPSVSSDVVYTYNAQAMRTYTQRPNSTSTNYDYDPAMRMDEISENLSGSAGDNTFLYTFNPANQIKTLSVSNQTYAVDHTAQGRPGVYQTNGLNQYTQANGGTLDYDTVGNMTLDEDEDAIYEYSIENQLTKAIKGAAITELGYDATGKLLNIGNTYFLYDGEAVIAERSQQNCYPCGRTMTTRYVHSVGIDDPIVQYNGSGTSSYAITYLHKNHQGSVVAGSAYNGTLGYDSFGVPEVSNQGRFAYTGQMYLAEIGLFYYKARMYHPKLGRFLQTDPVGYEDQMNLYAYVGNDPINMVDPTGKWGVAGFIIGAGLEVARQAFTGELKDTSLSGIARNAGKALVSGLAGATGAGLATKTAQLGNALRVTANTAGGGAIGAISTVTNNAIDGSNLTDNIGVGIVLGAAGGAAGTIVGDTIDAGTAALKQKVFNATSVADQNLTMHLKGATGGGASSTSVGVGDALGNVASNAAGLADSCGVKNQC